MAWPPGPCLGADQFDCGEVGAVAGGVAGQEPVSAYSGVCADVEAGQRGSSLAASLAVGEECFSREESCLVGERLASEVICGDGVLETAVPDGWPPARASGCTEPGLQASSPAACSCKTFA
jgi:hypothetical protein